MSIPVALDELAKALAEYDFAYLLTATDRGGPHVVAVSPQLEEAVFALSSVGRRTHANAVAHPEVTLVWPPPQRDGYSLIVDGEATAAAEGLRVTPQRAVLHRPAPRPEGVDDPSEACGSDCIELLPRQRTTSPS